MRTRTLGNWNLIVLLLAAGAVLLPPCATASMIGVTYDGLVVSINETTAVSSPIGNSGLNGLNALARSSTGVYYSATAIPFVSHDLVTIDPSTGAGSVVATLNFGGVEPSVRALAFSPAGVLYAVQDPGGLYATDDLYIIDPSTGAGTLVGNTGLHGIQSLTFSASGTLYGWDIGGLALQGSVPVTVPGLGLVTLNPAAGTASDVNAAAGNSASLQSLAFTSSGTLYGIGTGIFTRLYSIDPATGVSTLLGSEGTITGDIRGIECITCPAVAPAAAPEPAPASLFGLGLLALTLRRLRRRKENGVRW